MLYEIQNKTIAKFATELDTYLEELKRAKIMETMTTISRLAPQNCNRFNKGTKALDAFLKMCEKQNGDCENCKYINQKQKNGYLGCFAEWQYDVPVRHWEVTKGDEPETVQNGEAANECDQRS